MKEIAMLVFGAQTAIGALLLIRDGKRGHIFTIHIYIDVDAPAGVGNGI